ncbi:periplasmic heavy metal sensor [Hyphobacterium sp.]|uniref:periplasmic heavy metal sensor n=1 Tax=Hyphobacterium sp. TaxID=2004662 RepID=UPI003BA94D25
MNRALPWIIALLISLTANGVMTGLVLHQLAGAPRLGDVVSRDEMRPPPPRSRGMRTGGFNIRGFLRNLPPEHREMARQRFDAERETVRALMLAGREAQLEAEAALLANPYDAEAAATALDNLRQRRFEIESAVEDIVLDLVADLPAEERIRALEAGRRPHRPRRDRRPPPRDDF